MQCAVRELIEETGYWAADMQRLMTFYSTPGFCDERVHVFIATGLEQKEASPEAGEQIELAEHDYADALAAIGDGRIEDAKTIAALLYYDRYAKKGR